MKANGRRIVLIIFFDFLESSLAYKVVELFIDPIFRELWRWVVEGIMSTMRLPF
jgi:hypothetical protein